MGNSSKPGDPDSSPRKVLGLGEVIALIVGIVIGAGIFKAPSMVAGMTGDARLMFSEIRDVPWLPLQGLNIGTECAVGQA